jgi:DNA-binding beta-propeller fold protein YncE
MSSDAIAAAKAPAIAPTLTTVPFKGPERGPRFELDPSWPKSLPDGWIGGQLSGCCVDHDDNIIVTNRGDITAEETETCIKAPAVMIFDPAGNMIDAWGDWDVLPTTVHSCCVDRDNNVWISTNGDGMIQKYTHDGKLLVQIGKKGVFDTDDGTKRGKALNAGRTAFHKPAGITVDQTNGDLYVADGYGNRRVAVFDNDGKFLRQWGRQATPEETEAGVGGAFAEVVHAVVISNAGLVYVCDRQGDRIQVFDKIGNFKRNIWIRTGTPTLPDKRGTAWWAEFSPDKEQKYLYVMNGRNEQVHILDHASGEILSSFGRPGHQLGNFTHGHCLAIDSKGNIHVAETNFGRRIHKFRPVA